MNGVPADRSKLWVLALVVWLAWLAGVVVTWIDYRLHVLAPHFLPVVSLLAIQLVGGLALVAAGLWRVARGPRRSAALGWLLLGTTPLWLWSAHFSYGAWRMFTEHTALTAPVKMTGITVVSIADLVIRCRHPGQTFGKHFVLRHDPGDNPSIEPIDRHIEQMETILGRSSARRFDWVRGDVFGVAAQPAGWYLSGLAIVVRPATDVGSVDRHEIAHAVIEAHCGPDAQPPLVLVEGWAESQSGYRPGFLAFRAAERRRRGTVLSLRELTGERWYACGDWPVYEFGGALVEYLLDEYGGPKFLELYATCRRATFAEDCRHVLGVDLDTVDRQYWAFVDNRMRERAPDLVNPLLDVPLADGVDRDAWNEFARQYPDARVALARSLEHVLLEFRGKFQHNNAESKPMRVSIAHDGPKRRLLVEAIDEHYARVATPKQSFFVRRSDGGAPWKLDLEQHRGNPFVDYCALRTSMEREEGEFVVGGPEDIFKWRFVDAIKRDRFRVTRFEPWDGASEPAVRLEFEYTFGTDPEDSRHEESFVLLPERHWAMRECEARMTGKDFSGTSRSRFEFADPRLPVGVPSAAHWSYESSKRSIRRDVTLTEWKGRPAADSFELVTFGLSAADLPDRARLPWYVALAAAGGLASLVLGIVLVIGTRRIPSPFAREGGERK